MSSLIKYRRERIVKDGVVEGRQNIAFQENVFQFMIDRHKWFLNKHESDSRNRPWCALLGADENGVVKRLIKLYPHAGGCWNMPDIEVDVFADTAVKLAERGYHIVGLVRIGKFNLGNDGARGPSLKEFGQMAPKFFVVSIGLQGMNIESWDVKGKKVITHGWKIQKGGQDEKNECVSDEGANESGRTDSGNVRKTDGAGGLRGAEQSNDSGRVSEQKANRVQLHGSGKQENRGTGLHSEEQRHNLPNQFSEGGSVVAKTPEEADKIADDVLKRMREVFM